jgi:hypothetical protein
MDVPASDLAPLPSLMSSVCRFVHLAAGYELGELMEQRASSGGAAAATKK